MRAIMSRFLRLGKKALGSVRGWFEGVPMKKICSVLAWNAVLCLIEIAATSCIG